MLMLKKVKQYSMYIIMFLILIGMTIWNYTTPLWNDDEYATHMTLKSINQVGLSDYFLWNGRIIGQSIFRILVNIPLSIESFVNALLFVFFAILILLIAKPNKKDRNTINFLFVSVILFGLISDFTQIYIWRAGAGNYLWTTALDLLLIYLIKSNLVFSTKIRNVLYIVILSILGLIAGETNENTVGGIILIIIFYMFFKKLDFKKYVFPLLSTIIGYAILLLSPGEWKRAELTNPNFLKLNMFEKIHVNFQGFLPAVYKNEKYIIILFIILFILHLVFIKNYKLLIESSYWFISGCLTLAVLLLSPGGAVEPRTYFGAFVLMTVATVKLFNISTINNKFNIINIAIIILISIGTIYKVSLGIIDSYKTNSAINQRNAYILKEKKKGKKIIEVRPLTYYGNTKYSITFDHSELSTNPSSWVNGCTDHRFNVTVKLVNNK